MVKRFYEADNSTGEDQIDLNASKSWEKKPK